MATTPGLDEVYDLVLYFDPFDYENQKTYAIMNYYKVSFQRVIEIDGRTTIASLLTVWSETSGKVDCQETYSSR